MRKIFKKVSASLLMFYVMAQSTVTQVFAEDLFEKTETIAKPEVMKKADNLILNGIDWIIGTGVIITLAVFIWTWIKLYGDPEDPQSFKKIKKTSGTIFVVLAIILLAKQLIQAIYDALIIM